MTPSISETIDAFLNDLPNAIRVMIATLVVENRKAAVAEALVEERTHRTQQVGEMVRHLAANGPVAVGEVVDALLKAQSQIAYLEGEVDRTRTLAATAGYRARVLTEAITWALGDGPDAFPVRDPGQGPYYWRDELRRRATVKEG